MQLRTVLENLRADDFSDQKMILPSQAYDVFLAHPAPYHKQSYFVLVPYSAEAVMSDTWMITSNLKSELDSAYVYIECKSGKIAVFIHSCDNEHLSINHTYIQPTSMQELQNTLNANSDIPSIAWIFVTMALKGLGEKTSAGKAT